MPILADFKMEVEAVSMQAPRILISGILGDRSKYEWAVRRAGGVPLSCYCPSIFLPAEGLLLGGGGDIDPAFLGVEDCGSRDVDLARDLAEFALVRVFIAQKKPIFGICRGHQVLNTALGGSLLQDIGLSLERFHSPVPLGLHLDVVHSIVTQEESLLARLYGPVAMVNSWHHQAVEREGEGMQVTARSESGLIEATEHEKLPLFSVQFHPERLRTKEASSFLADGDLLFTHFVDQCRMQMEQG